MKIARLSGCKNFVTEREKFIFDAGIKGLNHCTGALIARNRSWVYLFSSPFIVDIHAINFRLMNV